MAVGITIEVIAAPGATPIAQNAASAKAFADDYYKCNHPNLSMRQRMTLAIIGLIHTVSAANYKSNHAGLIQDSLVFTKGISQKFDLFSALAGIDVTNGHAVDATQSLDVPTLLAEGRDLENKSEDELNRIYVFLRAQLLT
jgi:hypothetical protein